MATTQPIISPNSLVDSIVPVLLCIMGIFSVHIYFQVLEDFALEMNSQEVVDKELQALTNILQNAAPALIYDGHQMYSQIYSHILQKFPSVTQGKESLPLLKKLFEVCLNPPVDSLLAQPVMVENRTLDSDGSDESCIDLIARLGDNADFVATVSIFSTNLCLKRRNPCFHSYFKKLPVEYPM